MYLIKLQIKVAAGLDLPVVQDDVIVKGHSIEVRLTAEQPEKHFAPSAGTIDFVFLPTGGPGVRIDSALFNGDKIQPFYDSMIGKLIVKADDRETAMRKIQRVVDETVVRGVATSRNFQKALLADPQVQRGEFDTRYLETEFLPRWTQTLPDNQ